MQLYILTVYGGEWEDSFEYRYFSYDLESLKKEGLRLLATIDESSLFEIEEVRVKKNGITDMDHFKVIFSQTVEKVIDQVNYLKLNLFLNGKNERKISFDENMEDFKITLILTKKGKALKIEKWGNGEIIQTGAFNKKDCQGGLVNCFILNEPYED